MVGLVLIIHPVMPASELERATRDHAGHLCSALLHLERKRAFMDVFMDVIMVDLHIFLYFLAMNHVTI